MTMAFVSLVLIQFFKAYNFRSKRRSIVKKPFANRWLNAAVAWELGLLALVLYVPALEGAFGTYPLPLVDWVIVFAAVTIVLVLEAIKWLDGVAGSAPSQLFLRIARNTPRSLPALEVSPQVIDVVPQLALETQPAAVENHEENREEERRRRDVRHPGRLHAARDGAGSCQAGRPSPKQ